MVRTKADAVSSKVSVSKAPRKILGSSGGGAGSSNSPCRSSGSGKDRYSGGNAYNPQPTPNWQKGIGSFLKPGSELKKNEEKIESPEKEEMDCSDAVCSKDPTEEKEPIGATQSIESPKSPKADGSAGISEEKSFSKNGVISDDDD